MSNIIRVSELLPNSEWLVMSNQGTDSLNNECDIMKEIREPDKSLFVEKMGND